jgi:prepilin-type N-terminal cleavage/methylation domain-containing protein
MVDRYKLQQGFTLAELVVTIVLLGVALPSTISLIAQLPFKLNQNSIEQNALALAEEKMEEILVWKEHNVLWYKTITSLGTNEVLSGVYQRSVSVNQVSGWGDAGLDAWEIKVVVRHQKLMYECQYTVRFTIYQ